ncbi:MAG: hypothetical protein KDA44_20765 [Planctomycetales bacterium]|nr:hypothetical protein [Planctomycetales bacterium]
MRRVLLIIAAATITAAAAPRASALPQFQKEFLAKYIAEHPDAEYQELVKKKAKCNVCHQGKKDKHHMNPYGYQLSKLLDHKKDKKNVEKINAALTKVGKMHSKTTKDGKPDEKSPTFDELIADSKLPGGTLEDVLKEPAEDAEHHHEEDDAGDDK